MGRAAPFPLPPDFSADMSERVRVNIFNRSYALRSDSGGEHVERVARAVDERMRYIASQLATHDVAKVAVLAALNLADELQRLKDGQAEGETAPPREPESEARAGGGEAEVVGGRSWFENIFDADDPTERRGERLSSQLSARLQKLRQGGPVTPADEAPEG